MWFWLAAVAGQAYFPPYDPATSARCSAAEQAGMARVADFTHQWYGRQLSATGEPSLYAKAMHGGADSLRFTWIPTRHPTVTVRVERLSSAAPRLIAVRLDGAGGYDPGGIAARIDRRLSRAETRALRQALRADDPFALPPVLCGPGGFDGSQWLIERARGTRYDRIDRWRPRSGAVHATGMAMLRLTGWTFDRIY